MDLYVTEQTAGVIRLEGLVSQHSGEGGASLFVGVTTKKNSHIIAVKMKLRIEVMHSEASSELKRMMKGLCIDTVLSSRAHQIKTRSG